MEAIRIQNLTKIYKDTVAVDSLELTIHTGELFALLGINGAGKTTTIKMLACLSKPTAGDAYVMGKSVSKESQLVKSMIGISPQETAVAPNLTVLENLELMCGVYAYDQVDRKERIAELTRQFHLEPILTKRAGKLSGGWQRRLSIAMALVGQPQILFLDEPTLGLDVIARSELWDTIRALKGNVTIILTTHYMEEAENLSDRIGIMKNGKLIVQGTAEELKRAAGKEIFEEAFVALVKGEIV
ncbi:MAG: ABC transporter ATP-binding protein [Oscillospiraceae bacterium]|nr:ABC transporter ATP-binding protein [Oscillospiraceae bacterium]